MARNAALEKNREEIVTIPEMVKTERVESPFHPQLFILKGDKKRSCWITRVLGIVITFKKQFSRRFAVPLDGRKDSVNHVVTVWWDKLKL